MKNPAQRTFGSFSNKSGTAAQFDLQVASRMLPLVKQIAGDVSAAKKKRQKLETELNQLDSFRRELTWEARQRRYRIMEELGTCESEMENVALELKQLGVSVIDEKNGRVAFPTQINNRPATFTWQPDEERIMFWSYSGEEMRRPVPSDWLEAAHSKRS